MNDLIDYMNTVINTTTGNLDLLSISVSGSATQFDTLNENISDFIENLNKLNIPVFTASGNTYPLPAANTFYTAIDNNPIAESAKKEKSLAEKAKPYAEAANSLKKIATEGGKVYETFGKLPHVLEKVKSGAEFLSGAVDTFENVSKLTDKNTEASEKISATLGIVATMAEVAAVAAPLGPVGWAIGAGAMVVGGVAALAVSNAASEEPKKTFIDEATKNKSSYLTTVDNNVGLAAELIKRTENRDKSPQQIAKEIEKLSTGFLKQPHLKFDDERAGKDAIYLQAFVTALNKNDALKNHPIKDVMFRADEDKNAFQEKFDKMGRFPLATMPAITQQYDDYTPTKNEFDPMPRIGFRSISQKEADRQNSTGSGNTNEIANATDDALQLMTQSYLTNGKAYVVNGHKDLEDISSDKKLDWLKISDYYKEQSQAYERFENIAKVENTNKKAGSNLHHNERIDRKQAVMPQGGRTININLNKPMIEHFTINAKEMKDGIGDFKHKVEEVLLEILNSANAIQ